MPRSGKNTSQQKEVVKIKKSRGESEKTKKEKKLLVLDLDETLVHSRHATFGDTPDFSFRFSGQESTYYIKKRPDVTKFLERVVEMFEVMVFTASEKDYADRVLDFLDPEGKYISRRAYGDSGPNLSDGYAKDLSRLGVDLAKVVIIDNCPHNFRLQRNNGIPITSWFVDPQDVELSSLLPFLERLAEADDVRPIIAGRYGMNGKNVGNPVDSKKKENKKKGNSAEVLPLRARINKMSIN